MKLLLDTHILLALIGPGAASLPAAVAGLLRDAGNEHHLSAASLWEIAIKCRLGKLKLTLELGALPELLDGLGIRIVAIDERHALTSVEPEPMTRDPFDQDAARAMSGRGAAAPHHRPRARCASAGGEGIGSRAASSPAPRDWVRPRTDPRASFQHCGDDEGTSAMRKKRAFADGSANGS